jgi:hypothetical protein
LNQELKQKGQEIHQWKSIRRQEPRVKSGYDLRMIEDTIFRLKRVFRHKHILYCLLRGRKYLEIEQKTAEGCQPSLRLLESYLKEVAIDVL